MLPLFAERKVGWYNWGLVAGRTQTYMPWGSEEGTPMPDAWQHDVLHADGTPYDPEELERIREFGWLEVDDVVPPGGEWRYATDTPWYGYQLEAYDETKSEWHSGKAPFAAPGTPHAEVGTEWTTPNIWMRRTFTLDGLDVRALRVRVRHDAQAEVHINGELAVRVLGANTCGELLPIRDSARAALRLGENTLAVHCHRAGESQGIDVGLADIRSGVPAEPNGAAVELPEAGEVDCGPLWAAERTADWYERVGALKGCNYLPRTAINPIEMWQAETFDPETIDEELGWAAGYGYNSLRIFLPYLVWEAERDGLLARFERVLGICATHGMTAMPVFFDDVCFSQKLEPYLGPQDDPIVGIHNSGWVPSPGFAAVTDRREWPKLKAYVDDFVTRYREDERVVVWDIYNEPGPFFDVTTSFNLAKAGASWVRELDPIQPVTVPVWGNPDSRQLPAISDVASIHNYGGRGLEEFIQHQQAAGKPVLVTEWLARPSEGQFEQMLPLFAKYHVGSYHWGLVAGKTQTFYQYSAQKGDPMPEVWLHDALRPDGTPYDEAEMRMFSQFEFE